MRKAVIIGGGVSGIAAKKLAEKSGYAAIIVTDDTHDTLPPADLIIASPGVPPLKSGLYRQALESGIEFIGELEFGFRHWKRPLIAITGTNGKTTTTALLEHLLNCCRIKAESGGNIGRPLCDLALESTAEIAVVEVSNFQLELAPGFSPYAAILLNLESDHIDRYAGGFEEYCRVKRKIFDRVVPERQIFGRSFREWDQQRRVKIVNRVLFIDGSQVAGLNGCDLPGAPNEENLEAALELLLRFKPEIFQKQLPELIDGIMSFRRAAHRIEPLGEAHNINFINDSKGTNPAAVAAALDSLNTPAILLLGGLAKGMDFSILSAYRSVVRHAVLFGQDRQEIQAVLQESFNCHDCGSDFEAAFRCAVTLAEAGDTVLLSPGCASMDMFKNYKERGEIFRQLVKKFRENGSI